jgi:hypothetical protein
MCPLVRVYTNGFSTAVLHRVISLKCVNGCPTIILNAWLPADMKLWFRGPARSPDFLIRYFVWGYLKPIFCAITVNTRGKLQNGSQFTCETKEYTRNLRMFAFLFHAEPRSVSVNVEAIPSMSCRIVKIKRLLITHLFVFFL